MTKYIVKRILIAIPTLLAIILIVFSIMNLTPGNPAQVILGEKATPETIEALNHELGFDKPFFVRFGNYVVNLLKGDMGKSYRNGRPVLDEILMRLPITIKLTTAAIVLAFFIGVPLGILAAVKQYSLYDIVGTATAMFMASMPGFWFGLMAIFLFSLKLGWLPSNGSETWRHYLLPTITLAIPEIAAFLRLTRTTMLEIVRMDYIRTARSKGQKESNIIIGHAMKNAMLPVVTVAGMDFGALLGGVVTIESVFSINGVGTLILTAIRMKDIPQVTGCALILAFFFMVIMLIVDIFYAFIDPRIKARYQNS